MNTSKEERSLKKDLDRLNQWPGTNKKKFTRVKYKFLLLGRRKKNTNIGWRRTRMPVQYVKRT